MVYNGHASFFTYDNSWSYLNGLFLIQKGEKSSVGKIKELDYSTIVKIAAGEVIDRPSSVVRELIDNSLDAGASRISIFVTEGGKEYIEVADNGDGMDKDDLLICTKNHTTSKITNFGDIDHLKTLGFRGEALSSIAEVSKLQIISKEKNAISAYSINIEGGKVLNITETSRNYGTSVIVSDLFYNIPARKKFLSTSITETKNIEKEIIKKALSYYKVTFEFHSDGKKRFISPERASYLERINDFYPDSIKDLIQIEKSWEDFSIIGYISKPAFIRNNRQYEYFFVNNRPVDWKNFYFIINSVYEGIIPKGYYPAVFIYLTINPEDVDVNVHPMKKEVRFKDDQKITKMIKEVMENSLNIGSVYNIDQEKLEFTPYEERISKAIGEYFISRERETQDNFLPFEKKETIIEETATNEFYELKFVGSIFNTYLIFEENDKIIFLDQHAAHERIMYEKFKKNYEEKILSSQELLVPLKIELPKVYVDDFIANLETIEAFGFEIEHFGENSFIVRSAPVFVDYMDIENIIIGFAESLNSSKKYIDDSIKQMACKSSIKAGKNVSKEEAFSLVKELKNVENNMTCPHGRPIMVTFTKDEIEKMFKRSGF
ncbi:MAG: DNA mismatch repair endonuclease MutL [Brevinematales bacterium]|nr:DNA mismatch repair endonuclease MutL [Brevinematales bacterium]